MKDEEKLKLWNEFNVKYKEYLLTNDDKWMINYNKLIEFFDINQKILVVFLYYLSKQTRL